MYLSEIYKILNIELLGDKLINKIRVDSRLLDKDDIFICINDGYKYIKDAISKDILLILGKGHEDAIIIYNNHDIVKKILKNLWFNAQIKNVLMENGFIRFVSENLINILKI